MKEFLKKNAKFILLFIIAISVILFQQEEIKTHIKTIDKKDTLIIKRSTELNELKILLKESNEDKDIVVEEKVNSDGSYTKIKKIKTKKTVKESSREKIALLDTTEVKKKSSLKSKEKTKIHKNPKKLRLGIGINQSLEKELHFSYKIKGPFGFYLNKSIDKAKDGSFGIFMEF